jgi:GR25 family glycosyltransferase involved in LPS biosynthesis
MNKMNKIIFVLFVLFCCIITSNSVKENFETGGSVNVPKYIINLDTRPDRIKVTIPKLRKLGFTNVERLRATTFKPELLKRVDENHIDPIILNKRTKHSQLSKGAVGCYISHLRIYKKILEKSDYGIIFEDDVLPKHTLDELNNNIKRVPKDWDMILIGGTYNEKKENKDIVKVSRFFQTHAYVINKTGIEKILKKAYPIQYQIDSFLSDMSSRNELNIYGLNNMNWVVNQKISMTDIQTELNL